MDKAVELIFAGRWQEAAELDRARLQRNPDDLHAWLRLANALRQLGDDDGARSAWTRAIAVDPRNDIARKYLGLKDEAAQPSVEERDRQFVAMREPPYAPGFRTVGYHRTPRCWRCKSNLDNDVGNECKRCMGIICDKCDACGCEYSGWIQYARHQPHR